MSTVTLAQLNTALSDRYDLEREIGAGGMATVYLARDRRHQRRVALKVLKPELGAVLGVERFLSEIRVTASLQHPNLLPLFDSGEADGLLFYVMPFVDGESLRARLEREQQLPIDEAVRLAVAMAAALDHAHRHGVIHRDLKPENILLQDGEPLIADFGIALAVSNAGGNRITQTGVSLGTPQYMSPEQATGDRTLDGRTDIYSLGAVLYEMLTGEPPHTGGSAQAIIARVLTERPRSVRSTRDTTPPAVERAVERALAKVPADRWPTAREFANALRSETMAPRVESPARSRRGGWRALPWVVASAAAGVALIATRAAMRAADQPTTKFILATPPGQGFVAANGVPVTMTRDGRTVVYAGHGPQGTQLYLRRLDALESQPIAGTENALTPFLSPDGGTVGFSRGTAIFTVPVRGGTPNRIADGIVGSPRSPSWATSGDILVGSTHGILRVRPGSRDIDTLTSDARGQSLMPSVISHGTPVALPDGKHVVFWVRASHIDDERLAVLDLATKKIDTLDGIAANPLGMLDGYLLFGRSDGTINALSFVPGKTKSVAEATRVLDGVLWRTTGGVVAAVSPSGSLVYAQGSGLVQLAIVDEHGTRVGGDTVLRDIGAPAFSPDGAHIAVSGVANGGRDVWLYDIASGSFTRLTQHSAVEVGSRPAWSPDGKRLAFVQSVNGSAEIWTVPSDGSGAEEAFATKPAPLAASAYSSDGKYMVLQTAALPATSQSSTQQIWLVPLSGERSPRPLLSNSFAEFDPAVSPDSRLIAYASAETGVNEVYVRPFPALGAKLQVSIGGGREPHWSNDGRLFYRAANDSVVVATIATSPALAVTSHRSLFETRSVFSVSPDGKRFAELRGGSGDQQIVVVLNWINELRAKMKR